MITVTKLFTFDACHHLPHYEGACHNLHGHTYKLEVTVTGQVITDKTNPKCGMIIDFKDLKKVVNEAVVDKYDHANLNDFFENPTAEIMVEHIGVEIIKALPKGVSLVSVKLWEKIDSGYAEFNPLMDSLVDRIGTLERLLKYADQDTLRSAT